MMNYVKLTNENLEIEHICCAIGGKKHEVGVSTKKQWLSERIKEGHVFLKLDARGKVFIEYAPLEKAWVPISGDNYMYIYCHWVSGSFKNNGHGTALLEACIEDAKKQNKSGVCVLVGTKKKPFLSDKTLYIKHGFKTVDTIEDYELLALSFDGSVPSFNESARRQTIDEPGLVIYYGLQCPYIPDCVEQIKIYCENNEIPLKLHKIDSLKKAKEMPGVFNNWAVFYQGQFETVHLLNEGYLKKLLAKQQ